MVAADRWDPTLPNQITAFVRVRVVAHYIAEMDNLIHADFVDVLQDRYCGLEVGVIVRNYSVAQYLGLQS